MSDVWDIPFLNPKARERVGFPTQKPIALLRRIIDLTTDPDDTVLDPFCGSGTAVVAAVLADRKGIGIDINADAVRISRKRLESPVSTDSRLLREGTGAYRTTTSAEIAVLDMLGCNPVQRDRGRDGFLRQYYNGSPVAVRIQKDAERLDDAVKLLREAGDRKRCSYTLLIRTARDAADDYVKIPDNMIIVDHPCLQLQQGLEAASLARDELQQAD